MSDVCQLHVNFTLIIARSALRYLCKSPIPERKNFWVNFHWELGSYLIFIPPLIACLNYNLGLKKGFGINWIHVAAIGCVCMLIHSAPPLETNLIKYTNNTLKPDASWEKVKASSWMGSKQCYSKKAHRENLTWWQSWKVLSLYIWMSLHPLSPYIRLSFFLYLPLTAHTQTHTQDCWSGPPLRSSNMQPGSRMIKAVAGGLHFETINRPPRAESNSKPSISVSASSGLRTCRGWEGRLHLCLFTRHRSMPLKNRGAAMEEFWTLWCDFMQALWIHPDDPETFDPWGLRGREESHLLQYIYIPTLNYFSLQRWNSINCRFVVAYTVYGVNIGTKNPQGHCDCLTFPCGMF